jgi:MFS transporter, DHA3 family, macrolide efflux protein
LKELRGNKPFLYLFSASLWSVIGEGIFSLTAIYLILNRTESLLQIGVMLVLTLLPSVLLGPLLGVLLDRFNITKISSLFSFFRFCSIILIPSSHYLHFFSNGSLYLMIILSYICWFVLEPAKDSTLKLIIKNHQYGKGISYIQGISQVGFFLSALLAGILIKWVGIDGTIFIAALTYIPASLLYGKLTIKTDRNKKIPLTKQKYQEDLKEGWSYLFQNKQVLYYGIIASMVLPFYYGINTLLAPFTTQVLKGNSFDLGLIDSGAGIGSLLSAFFTAQLRRKRTSLALWISIISSVFVTIVFSLSRQVLPAFLIYVLIGIFMGNVKILSRTLIFQLTDEPYIGRVMSAISLLSLLNAIFSALLTAYIGSMSLFYAYIFIAVFFIIPCVFVILANNQRMKIMQPAPITLELECSKKK